jgi:RNA polymerase sigma factor (sigma-70 family)
MSKRKIVKSEEGSAYWGQVTNDNGEKQDGRYREAIDANPDQLSDADTIIKKSELSDDDQEALTDYYKLVDAGILKKLAPRQREIWKQRFFRWCTEEEIAQQFKLSLSAVRTHLQRAGAKIKFEIEKRQKRREMMSGNYFNNGFKKGVHQVGETNTDKEFEARMEKAQPEIDDFCRRHPELRKGE